MISRFPVLVRFIADLMTIPVVIIAAYTLKFKLGWMSSHFFSVPLGHVYKSSQIEPYLSVLWLILLVWIFTFYVMGVYKRFTGLMPEVDEWVNLFKGVTLATLEIMALTFVYKSFPGSRYVIFYSWILGLCLLTLTRLVINFFEKRALKRGDYLRRALVVGLDSAGQDIIERILLSPSLGYAYAGSLADNMPEYCHFHVREKIKLLGQPNAIEAVLQNHSIDTVFVTAPLSESDFLSVISVCKNHQVHLKILPHLHPMTAEFSMVEDVDGIIFASTFDPQISQAYTFFKRVFDVVFSLCALVGLSPVLLVIAAYIKWVSPTGPVLYAQERVGEHQTPFRMLKFRTMIPDAESKTGPVMVSETAETRYIRGGDFLRKTSLDELPQLFNILAGTMSVVGPRPERPFFVNQFSQTTPQFPLRHYVKGGLTGWAQVNGRSVLTRNPAHKLRYDLYYIQHCSLAFDIKIILKTVLVVFNREEAY
jgi:exopolysaccharide biosynthesis polyprenyl glycosylphosphotransferase